ncbi:ABC transporter B family member 11 [Acorus gramineus]|uniref:ABC transporter B family member 11 n=1 Tax=Acorus gramineus TaxID=55184 RepID=A0AAV9BPP0_ACOGR|nr:ABC transporter B family member 11 [Acorus gramineus]
MGTKGEGITLKPLEDNITKEKGRIDGIGAHEAASLSEPTARINDSKKSKGEEISKKSVPFYRLFAFADSKDVVLMVVGTVASLLNGVSMPLSVILFGQMTNAFGQNTDVKTVVHEVSKESLKFVYLAAGAGLAAFLQVSCWMITGERQSGRIRNLYLKTILRQEIAFFDMETKTGEVIGRMSGDTVLIQDAMGEKVGKFLQLMATFIGGFVVAFTQGWLLTLALLSSIPALVFSGAVVSILVTKMAAHGQTAYADAAVVVEQTIGAIRTVASFTGEKQAVKKYEKSLKRAYKSSVQQGLTAGLGLGAVSLIVFCSYSFAVWFGGKMVLNKGYDGGKVVTVMFSVFIGSISLGQASPCMNAFAAGQAAAFKMFETIKRKPEIDAYDTSGKTLIDNKGNIELRDVHFSYPTRPDEKIFAGLSLVIPCGMTMALVGESGSGKSTVLSLIERFYDPQAGEVLIDDVNIKEFQLRWIRGKISLVSQEPVLFASSIGDNIAYGKDGATPEEIKDAAELANAAKFIDTMPQGLDTLVGEHGTQLSGGQKQRIAIARAILKDPRILLLDEATSALDSESEHVVQEALERVMTNRTTVIVAHRLSTVRNANMISVIHRGVIVEKGSHSELLKDPNGAYCQLIRLQQRNQGSDNKKIGEHERPEILEDISSQSVSSGLPTGVDLEGKEPQQRLNTLQSSQKPPDVPLRRLAYLNKPEIPALLLGIVSATINGGILPVFSILFSSMIKTFFEPPPKLKKDSQFWALMFIVLGLISFVATPARSYLFAIAGSRLIKRIRSMSFEKVVHMEIGWFDEPENTSGAIGAKLSADAATVGRLVGDALALIVESIAMVIIGLVIAFAANWQLSLIILALIPILILNGLAEMKFMKGFSANAKMMYEEASQVANDAVGSIRTVASFCGEEKLMTLYKKKCEEPMRTGIKRGMISGVGYGLSLFLMFCAYAVSFYAGARLVDDGKTTFDKVFRVFLALALVASGVSQTSSIVPDAIKAKASTGSIFAILDRKSNIDPSDESGMKLETVKGNIEFQHVCFKYPSRPDVQIFRDLCLAIQSGKTVALVGESGSGKSTAIALLQRFYDIDSGHILLDGLEIQNFQLRWLRQQMGLVSQEPVLFNDTIRANIAYGKEGDATEVEILDAAKSANAHNFICGLQQGYDSLVGERGIQLSGGQKQRVAIARAMVKDPKILLLDEATSALDAESERVVQDALDRVMVNRTTIVVAHRLSTIIGADLIAVVKNGMIAEKGRHESLININNGAYASLVALHSSTPTQN